jgi:hypothetical protein
VDEDFIRGKDLRETGGAAKKSARRGIVVRLLIPMDRLPVIEFRLERPVVSTVIAGQDVRKEFV